MTTNINTTNTTNTTNTNHAFDIVRGLDTIASGVTDEREAFALANAWLKDRGLRFGDWIDVIAVWDRHDLDFGGRRAGGLRVDFNGAPPRMVG